MSKKVNPDITETVATKKDVGEDQAEMLLIAGVAGEFLLKQAQQAGKLKLLEQTLLNVHFLMHEARVGDNTKKEIARRTENLDKALGMLCLATALIEGRDPPEGALDEFVNLLNETTTERAKGNCQGHA